jgi:hypothetical protein
MKRQRREGGITQRSQGTFQIRYEIPNPGGPRQTIRETVKATNRSEAQKILNAKLAARDNGSWVEPNKTTLVEFITEPLLAAITRRASVIVMTTSCGCTSPLISGRSTPARLIRPSCSSGSPGSPPI